MDRDRERERDIYWKQTSTKLQSATVVCQSKKQQWIHLALSVRFPSKNRGQPWYETYVRLQLFGWEEILKTRTHCIRNPIFSVPDNKTFGRTHIRLTFSLYSCVCIVCGYVCVLFVPERQMLFPIIQNIHTLRMLTKMLYTVLHHNSNSY